MGRTPFSVAVAAGIAVCGISPAAAMTEPAEVAASTFESEVAAARAAMMADPESALRHARAAAALCANPAPDHQLQQATAAWLEAEALMRVNRPQEAGPAIARGLTIALAQAPNSKLHADLLKARASLALVTGDSRAAQADLLAAREMFRALGETRSEAIVLQNLGSLHSQARDYDRALHYFALSLETHPGDPALTLAAHNNRGNALKELRRFVEAEREYRMALEAARTMGSELLQSRILSNLASALTRRGYNDQAETIVQLGLGIAHRAAVGWEPYLWGVRAQIALSRRDLASARTYIERAFAGVDLDRSNMSFREFHETAQLIYTGLGDATSAARHSTAFRRLDDQDRTIAAATSAALVRLPADAVSEPLRLAAAMEIEAPRRPEESVVASVR